MTSLPQAREGLFNPTSPHSSSGAADSFKGTPDTRLTAFSPEDGPASSSKAFQSFSITNRHGGPIKFPVTSPRAIKVSSPFYRAGLNMEKDPFVTTRTQAKTTQKLSPTAAAFAPIHTALPARDSSTEPVGTPNGYSFGRGQTPVHSPLDNVQHDDSASQLLSTESGLSRCLVIFKTGEVIYTTDITSLFFELESSGRYTFHGYKQTHQADDKVFVRFENIRDACFIHATVNVDRRWVCSSASYITTREFSQHVEPAAGLTTAHEAQIYLNAFATQGGMVADFQHLETILKRILQSQGDLFAFKAQALGGAVGSVFSAVAEYCDNDTSLRAVSMLNNHIIDIMLRNIPNKVDQAHLKRIVDESSWGKYDFMYLRIDFANDCNVGYAFINFVDPLDIIDFVNARGNQRWNCFKSDKVAEISYATIQGKDCLVQKFRNSSVMLEAQHYRPKLYYTLNGPRPELSGQEEPFPGPDNQSKMKRSCENAEHVGTTFETSNAVDVPSTTVGPALLR
ncbi:RNA recognition motif 2-domain-containing protein [Xylariaceae sp. FL0804]|nr:RNA recognition motif 2-domain-containing protein [Xylariaceae sp. FL0804]